MKNQELCALVLSSSSQAQVWAELAGCSLPGCTRPSAGQLSVSPVVPSRFGAPLQQHLLMIHGALRTFWALAYVKMPKH